MAKKRPVTETWDVFKQHISPSSLSKPLPVTETWDVFKLIILQSAGIAGSTVTETWDVFKQGELFLIMICSLLGRQVK